MSRELLIFAALFNQIAPQPPKFVITPSYLSDSEVRAPWPTPPNMKYRNRNYWTEYNDFADDLGLLFAGRSEFQWIVDIGVSKELDQETRATGNIVSSRHVLTNCRAIRYFSEVLETVLTIKVTFCAQYLLEGSHTDDTAGVRYADEVKLHPMCTLNEMANDVALLILKRTIEASPPAIGYMPFEYEFDLDGIPSKDLSMMEADRVICYVASFGRDYSNIQNHMVSNFKIKFRVYYERWRSCTKQIHLLCPDDQDQCKEALRRSADRRLVCMMTRCFVGTVCDHDRGSPVVCDGKVFGFVVRGVPYKYCNDRLPVPFVMAQIDALQGWLRPYLQFFTYNHQSETMSKASTNTASSVFIAILSLIVLFPTN